MADWLTAEQRSRNMAAIRSSGTSPERRLGVALRTLFPSRRREGWCSSSSNCPDIIRRRSGRLKRRSTGSKVGLRVGSEQGQPDWLEPPARERQPSSSVDDGPGS
jgi:hypothetical protein